MTAPDAVVVPPEARRHLAAAGRFLAAAVIGGIVGGIVFLIMVQGAFRRGYTDLDFNHVLGTLVEGTASETTSTDEALGIIGDTVGKSGLYATCIAAVALMILHGLVITRLVRRHWLVQALPLAVVTFLVVGLLYCGLADSRLDTPTGLFGADAGGMTPLVLGLSSLGFAVVASRCFSLIEDAGWWAPKHESIETALEAVPDVDGSPAPSLELAEEGPEQRRVRP